MSTKKGLKFKSRSKIIRTRRLIAGENPEPPFLKISQNKNEGNFLILTSGGWRICATDGGRISLSVNHTALEKSNAIYDLITDNTTLADLAWLGFKSTN